MDRGTFAPYARFEDDSEAAAALARLTTAPAAPLLDRPANQIRDAAGRLAARLVSLTGDDGVIPSKEVPVGTPFDHLGNESGHCLYLFGTPMQQRSLPPTDLNEHRLGYVLRGQLPDGAAVVRVPPWFGQPGGGVMVTLDRVIASYCDAGLLERFRLA